MLTQPQRMETCIRLGMGISSRSTDPFLASLTNPTELARRKGKLSHTYPVTDKTGKHWADSEASRPLGVPFCSRRGLQSL